MSIELIHIWERLVASSEFRAGFVAAHAKQIVPLQLHELMKAQHLTQDELAERSGLSQGTISRALDLEYGSLTINTCVSLAVGLDVAFVPHFIPFSELLEWLDDAENRVRPRRIGEDRPPVDRTRELFLTPTPLDPASQASQLPREIRRSLKMNLGNRQFSVETAAALNQSEKV